MKKTFLVLLLAFLCTFSVFSDSSYTERLSYQYGPEVFVMTLPPVKFSFDFYPFDRYQGPYLGMDFSLMAVVALWGSVSVHTGYKYQSFSIENNISLFVMPGGAPGPNELHWELMANPKAMVESQGAFFRVGPSFDIFGNTPLGHSEFPYLRIFEVSFNIELGLYQNNDTSYKDFIRRFIYSGI